MDWNKDKVRALRLRMGWSQSDLARHLQTDISEVQALETTENHSFELFRSHLTMFWQQADTISEELKISALTERFIEDENLSQVFRNEYRDRLSDDFSE